MSVKLLDLLANRARLRSGMTGILDRVFAENRSLTVTEEIQFDAMALQLRETDGELENRRILAQTLHEHVLTLIKNGNAQ